MSEELKNLVDQINECDSIPELKDLHSSFVERVGGDAARFDEIECQIRELRAEQDVLKKRNGGFYVDYDHHFKVRAGELILGNGIKG